MGLQRSDETAPTADDDSLATGNASLCGGLPPQQGEESYEDTTEASPSNDKNATVETTVETNATTNHNGTLMDLLDADEKADPQCGGGGPANIGAESRQETDLEVAKLLSIPDYCNSKTANIFAESGGLLEDEKDPTSRQKAPEIASDNYLDMFLGVKALDSVDLDDWAEQEDAMGPLTQNVTDPLGKMDTEWHTNNPFASEDEFSNPAAGKNKPNKRVRFNIQPEEHFDTDLSLEEPWFYPGTAPLTANPPPPYAEQEGTTTNCLGVSVLPESNAEKENNSKRGLENGKSQAGCAFGSSDPDPVPAYFLDAAAKGKTQKTRSGSLRYMGIEQEGWKTIIVVDKVSVLVHPNVAQESNNAALAHFTTGWGIVESRMDDPTAFRLIVCDETMDPRQFIMAIVPSMKIQDASTNDGLTTRVCNFTAGERCHFVTIQGLRETMEKLKIILRQIISKPRA